MLQCQPNVRKLKTTSNFWVGNVPFKILCGWPWQVRNKIDIKERNDGTWLSHRAVSGEAVWEVCAVPAQNPTDDSMNSHLFGHHHHPHCHHHHPFPHAETREKPPPEVDENDAYTWLLNPTWSGMTLQHLWRIRALTFFFLRNSRMER